MKIRQFDDYDSFHCLGGPCPDNCCIGDELVLDEEIYRYYMAVPGAFGDRLRATLKDAVRRDDYAEEEPGVLPSGEDDDDYDDPALSGDNYIHRADSTPTSRDGSDDAPHPGVSYCLEVDGRCPFLDDDNYCSIVRHLGEDALSDVCAGFPRTEDIFAGALERGLMAACPEQAGRLLTREEPLAVIEYESDDRFFDETEEPEISDDEDVVSEQALFDLRGRVIAVLQDRSRSLSERIQAAFELAGRQSYVNLGADERRALLFNLPWEHSTWPEAVKVLTDYYSQPGSADFSLDENFALYDLAGASAAENLLVNDVFRLMPWALDVGEPAQAQAPDAGEPALPLALAVFSLQVRCDLAAAFASWDDHSPEVEDLIRAVTAWSKELDFSEENLLFLFTALQDSYIM